MTMTRQDFQLIADVLKSFVDKCGSVHDWPTYDIAEKFADRLELTNPNFDRARFLKACGVKS